MIQALVTRTNNYYGGLNFDGDNVIFVNGDKDPWHILSLYLPNRVKSPIFGDKLVVNSDLKHNNIQIIIPGRRDSYQFYTLHT